MSIRPFRAAILLFVTLIGVSAFAQSYTWQHFAGDPGGGASIDGNGTNARLHSGGLTRDRAGNLYFADTTANVIRRVTPAGEVTTVAGLAGVTGFVNGTDQTARFNRPVGLAIDANDNILVADTWNHAIRKITPAGVVTTVAGTTSFNPFTFPEGVAVDRSNGTVYVADTLNHVVRKIVNGTVSVLAGTSGSSGNVNGTGSAARFNEPRGISVDTNGEIYVGDSGNSTIRKITPAGAVTTVSSPFGNNFADGLFGSARFNTPTQLSFAANRDLFISDQNNGRIRKASAGVVSTAALLEFPTGVVADEAGGAFAVSRFGIRQVTGGSANPFVGLGHTGAFADGIGGAARFKGPYDADTDSLGNVYVADANNCSIRKITPAGVVTTLAGVPGQCGSTDGNLSTARFYGSLYGIDVDDNGNVYIAEGWSHVIRKIAADGTVTTIAGTAELSGHVNAVGSAARFNVPHDLVVVPSGDIYVADTYNHVIRKIAPDGTVSTLAGSPGSSGTTNGIGSSARLYYPHSIAYAGGELFFTESWSGGVRRVTLSGEVTSLNNFCSAGGTWSTPWGITSDAAGVLYVSDYGNPVVRRIDRFGSSFCVTIIGGAEGQRGSEEGTGGFARLGAPVGTAVAPDGTLYVVEQAWLTVRRGTPATITAAPTVPTSSGPAGTPITLGVSGTDSTSWQWRIVRRPGASSGSLLSSATDRNPVFTPDVAGLYTFLLTANGPTGISMRRVSFTATCVTPPAPAVTVTAGSNPSCAGQSVTLEAAAGYTSYLWSNGATTRTITVSPSVQTTYSVTGYNGLCASPSSSHVQAMTTATNTIAVSGSASMCAGGSGGTATATDTGTPASRQWGWRATTGGAITSIAGQTGVSYALLASDFPGAGTYFLVSRVTSSCGTATVSNEVAVTINAAPAATITPSGPTTFCEGGSVTLQAPAGNTYLWSTGATTQSIAVTASGSYSVTVTSAAGCSAASAPVSVTVNPLPPVPVITANGPTSFCEGGSVTLTAPDGYSYLWSNGATTQSIVVTAGGSYSVTTTNAAGCSKASASTAVTVQPLPDAAISASTTTLCQFGSAVLTAPLASSYLWSSGQTTREIVVFQPGTWSVTVTGANGCSATSAPVTVTADPTTVTIVADDTTVCPGQTIHLTSSVANGPALSYQWFGFAGHPIEGETGPELTTVADQGYYFLRITTPAGCTAQSNTVVISRQTPEATVTTSGPTTFCEGGSVDLFGPDGAYTYLWSNGATSSWITVTEPGSYTVTITSTYGCTATSEPVVVDVTPLPDATITPDGPTTFCEGGSVTLSAPAGSTYAWSTGATTQSIVVTESGSYSVTVTNAEGCSSDSAATTVTVNALPTPTIGASGPTTFCEGGSVTLTASAGSSYLWSTGATTSSIVVTQSGNYSVTVTNANGCSATSAGSTVTVNANPEAAISASGATTFCEGGSVTLTASAGSSYLWSNGATTASIVATQSGSYTVTVTNANGCSTTSAATSVTVNANPVATISAGGPTTFCEGGSVTLTASAGSSYLWSNGATTASIVATQSGSYTVTVMNANGCSTTSAATSVTVNANPVATISAGGPTTFCTGGSVTLTASAGSSYLWSNGATTASINVTQTGSYTVTVTNANGCSTTSAATSVTVNANPVATISAGGPTTFCTGGSVTLTASAGSSYLWSNGATTASIVATQSGSYTVTVTNANGCSTTSAATSVTVNANPVATISAGGPTTFCTGGSVTLTASAGSSYLWSNGATTASIVATQSGSYTVTVTNANGCSTTSAATSVTVNANPAATISASGPTTFCTGGSVTLTASAGSSYLWSNGATTSAINVTQSGSYTVTVTNANGCSTTSAATSVTVNANPAATISAGGPTTFCTGGSVTLTASAGSSYLWSTGATTSAINVTQSGSYTVTVTNANGCSTTSAATSVTVNANPAATISASGPTTFCTGGSVTLTASAGSSYLWSTGATTSAINVTQSGSYTVTVTNANGCSTTSAATSVTVNANPATPTIGASGPTTFCPGGSVTLTAPAGYTYLWSNGATTQSIVVTTAGSRTVTVTNASGCSATSAATTVTVNAATSISVQPQSKTIPKNTSTQLSVTASGTGTLTYQWYRGTSGNTAQPIAGATNSTYPTPVLTKGTYTYWVRVTGTCGFVNSNTATITAN